MITINFRKIILISILSIVLISIFVNSFIYSSFINNYFKGYIYDEYQNKIDKIKNISLNYLENNSLNKNQLILQLENYIEEPIYQIDLYNSKGDYLLGTSIENPMLNMHNRMMNMGNSNNNLYTDTYKIQKNNTLLGTLIIKRNMKLENTENINYFRNSLISSSLLSIAIVIILAFILSMLFSKKISNDFKKTVELANKIDQDEEIIIKESKIKDIQEIQNTLKNISNKLKLKKNIRKEELDKITHEIKTPIMILKSNLEGIKDEIIELDESRIESLNEEIDKLSNLTNNIKNIIIYEKNIDELKVHNFKLNKEIEKIYKGMKIQFERKNIDINFISEKNITITSDKYLINQAVYNILSNSYKYTESGEINITLQEFKDIVNVIIEDTGEGIEKENIDKIFDAYYRINTQKNGSGLGLYITKNNIEKIGGKIKVFSEKNKGTKFIIELPKNIKS